VHPDFEETSEADMLFKKNINQKKFNLSLSSSPHLIPLILTYNSDQKFTHHIPTQPKNNHKSKKQTAKHPKMRRGE